jgi:hypothetical protein
VPYSLQHAAVHILDLATLRKAQGGLLGLLEFLAGQRPDRKNDRLADNAGQPGDFNLLGGHKPQFATVSPQKDSQCILFHYFTAPCIRYCLAFNKLL